MNAKIIPMSEEYRDKLINYMHQKYPSYSDAYIQYDVNEAIGTKETGSKSILVVNDYNDIVGCHLNFITKAWIKGEEKIVVWGHNTFLDEEYRREMGMDFVLDIHSFKNGFGYNLTDINTKIQNKFKSNTFVSGLRLYRIYNWNIICSIITKLFGKSPMLPSKMPSHIHTTNNTFSLCNNANDIDIPNNGYWYKDICDVDFIRDATFLNQRFFNNPVNKYYVYTNQHRKCYFVVRPIISNGNLSIQLVDSRYMPYQLEMPMDIYKAIKIICTTIHIGKIFVTSSDRLLKSILEKKKLCKSWPIAFVCGKNNAPSINSYIIVNAADSDSEFHY